MKRYLTIARQVAKEKIGTKDDTINSDEVESEREHFITLKEGYTKTHGNAKALYNEHWPIFMDHTDSLIAQLLVFSEALKGSNYSSPSTTTIAESLGYVGNGLQRENKIADYCIQSDRSGFLETSHKICDIYLKDVNELRSKQELARLHLSHTIGQLKNIQKKASVISSKDTVSITAKLQQAEEENRLAQAEYDKATSLFIEGMGRLETAGRNDMEDGVAMWKDVLSNLEKLDERDSLNNATPPTTPTPLPKSVSTQTSTPSLPPKNAHPVTPKSTPHTPAISPSATPPNNPTNITLDIMSFDPFDQAPSVSLSGGDPALRRNSSPKPVQIDSNLTQPTTGTLPYQSTPSDDHLSANSTSPTPNTPPAPAHPQSSHLQPSVTPSDSLESSSELSKSSEQEEYEELAL